MFFSGISEETEHQSSRVINIQATQVLSQAIYKSAHVLVLLYSVAQGWECSMLLVKLTMIY